MKTKTCFENLSDLDLEKCIDFKCKETPHGVRVNEMVDQFCFH